MRGSLALGAGLVLTASCGIFESVADAPGRLFDVFANGDDGTPSVDLDVVRNESLRFADQIVNRVETATRIFAARLPRQEVTAEVNEKDKLEAHERGLIWRLNTANHAYQSATQARPIAALADLIALCVYEKRVHELYWSKRYGEADEAMQQVWDSLTEEGLEMVSRLFSKDLSRVMAKVITKWDENATDPDELQRSGALRFEDLVPRDLEEVQTMTLLDALGLDPFDSIEPAAREIARSRELAERAVYLAQRAPQTLSWRTELLTLRLTDQPDVETALASIERTSRALESASEAVETLPEQLRIEGSALIQALERTAPATQTLLETAERTLDAGTRTAQAVGEMANAFGSSGGTPSEEDSDADMVADTNTGKPFDPVEYTALAAQTTRVLEELTVATQNADATLPAVRRTIDDAGSRLEASLDHAFVLAMKLVLIAVGAVFAAVLVLRFVPSRRRRK